jgi:anti-sigma regulatory factor (Ser/Thr protein kinase)
MSRDALCTSGVDPRDVDNLEVLVAELATNAIRHTRAPSFRVDLQLYEGLAVITVTDAGKGFERDKVPVPGSERWDTKWFEGEQEAGGNKLAVQQPRIGGFGLPMVETLADQVEYLPAYPRGTVVRARRRVAMVQPDAAAHEPRFAARGF